MPQIAAYAVAQRDGFKTIADHMDTRLYEFGVWGYQNFKQMYNVAELDIFQKFNLRESSSRYVPSPWERLVLVEDENVSLLKESTVL